MSIYEKSTNQLLTEYIKANMTPGQVMDKDQIVTWFKTNYPKIKSNTVNCHIIKFTTNHRTRIHYNAGPSNDLLFQLPDKRLRLYNPESDPAPIYEGTVCSGETGDEGKEKDECVESSEFAYESHLRDYLKDNLSVIEPGLKLYRDEEDDTIVGVEFDVGGKRIDILGVGQKVAYVRQAGFDPIQQEQMVLAYIDKHGSIKRAEVMDLCRITKDQAYKLLSRLKRKGQIAQIGMRKGAIYERKR